MLVMLLSLKGRAFHEMLCYCNPGFSSSITTYAGRLNLHSGQEPNGAINYDKSLITLYLLSFWYLKKIACLPSLKVTIFLFLLLNASGTARKEVCQAGFISYMRSETSGNHAVL